MFDQTCFNRLATQFNISLVTKQWLMTFGRQTFLVWTGLKKLYNYTLDSSICLHAILRPEGLQTQ